MSVTAAWLRSPAGPASRARPTGAAGAGSADPASRGLLWLLGAAALAGAVAGLAPSRAVVALAAVGLVVCVAVRPVVAAVLWLFVTPLVVGMDRGSVLPVLRPNEALLLLLLAALVARGYVQAARGRQRWFRLTSVDLGFALLVLTGCVLPLLWAVARGEGLSRDDLLSAVVAPKYYLLFLVFRMAVTTERQVRTALWAALASGAMVAVLAVLQSMQLLGVPALLASHWAPTGADLATGRGSSTIGNPQATADVVVFTLAVVLALVLRGARRRLRWGLLALSAVLFVGALGSGQVSGLIALLVGLVAVGAVLGQARRIGAAASVAGPLAVLALAPVVAARLASVDPSTGLPSSWSARLTNLSTYFWPTLFDGYHWVLGVRLLPEATGREPWQPTVYIESGHTWLLWIGGVPYLLAFFAFVLVALRTCAGVARADTGPFGAAAAGAFAAYACVFVLTFFDPHLFLRGSADLAVPLLALATSGELRRRARRRADDAGLRATGTTLPGLRA